jgi:hypothetical protein
VDAIIEGKAKTNQQCHALRPDTSSEWLNCRALCAGHAKGLRCTKLTRASGLSAFHFVRNVTVEQMDGTEHDFVGHCKKWMSEKRLTKL